MKKSINMWKWKGRSLLARIQIVETFAFPNIMCKASVVSLVKELIKEANSIFFGFIWNGKDQVKRHALICNIRNGWIKDARDRMFQ